MTNEDFTLLMRAMDQFPAYIVHRDGGIELVSNDQLWAKPRDAGKVNDVLTFSAAHRLISSLAEQTASRAELDECRDVMAKLEKMVGER